MIHTIDEAFRSRIRVAYAYEDLDAHSRRLIWTDFIQRMDSTRVNKKALLAKAAKWAAEELNARQIRNILMTAETSDD